MAGPQRARLIHTTEPTKEAAMMMSLAKPSVALAYGAFFLCAAACTHLDGVASLSMAPDWAAGLFMVGGALASGRDWDRGRTYQAAAWAFMVSLLFASFLGNLEEWMASETDGVTGVVSLSQGTYVASIGILLVFGLGGLISSMRSPTKV
jgi:hypothetical protein